MLYKLRETEQSRVFHKKNIILFYNRERIEKHLKMVYLY